MERIESAGAFREKLAHCWMVGETQHLAYQEGGKEKATALIEARDAAIRADEAGRCAQRAVIYVTKTGLIWADGSCHDLRLAITQGTGKGGQE